MDDFPNVLPGQGADLKVPEQITAIVAAADIFIAVAPLPTTLSTTQVEPSEPSHLSYAGGWDFTRSVVPLAPLGVIAEFTKHIFIREGTSTSAIWGKER